MDRRQLECFVGIAERGSFTSAAAALHISQPAITRTIQSLERGLGFRLFRRNRYGVVLTAEAARLLPRARTILSDFEALGRDADASATGPAGRVTIALTSAPAIEPMTSLVAAALEEHPGIRTTGVAFESPASAVAAVRGGICDFAIVGSDEPGAGGGIVVERLGEDELVVVAPAGLPLPDSDRVRPADLRGLPFIAAPHGTLMRRVLDAMIEPYALEIVAEVAHREAMLPMVARGIGLAVVSSGLWRSGDDRRVVRRGLDPAVGVGIWLVSRTDLAPAALALRDVARRISAPLAFP